MKLRVLIQSTYVEVLLSLVRNHVCCCPKIRFPRKPKSFFNQQRYHFSNHNVRASGCADQLYLECANIHCANIRSRLYTNLITFYYKHLICGIRFYLSLQAKRTSVNFGQIKMWAKNTMRRAFIKREERAELNKTDEEHRAIIQILQLQRNVKGSLKINSII